VGIVVTIVLAAIVNWDFFFTTFHTMLFESGTWRFAYSDTLIRLFPEQFWFDAALLIGGLTTLIALLLLFAMWRWTPESGV
jgi:integral membrane protein (TIGR01906 family)